MSHQPSGQAGTDGTALGSLMANIFSAQRPSGQGASKLAENR